MASLRHSQEAINRGFVYNCYIVPQEQSLQIPLLGKTVTGLGQYIERVFRFFVSVAGVIAGIMIVYAGFKWLTAAGSPEKISDARRKISDASVGLILVLASYLILQTVNPALVRLQLPPTKLVRQVSEILPQLKCPPQLTKFLCGGQSTEARYSVRGETRASGTYFPPDSPNRGAYSCNKPEYREFNPCGQSTVTDCTGQYCSEGECYEIVPDRLVGEERLLKSETRLRVLNPSSGCFDPGECNNCNINLPRETLGTEERLTPEGIRNLRLCISTACNCITHGKREDDSIRIACTRRQGLNASCTSNEECIGAYTCINDIRDSHAVGRCENPGDYGVTCYEDSDCMTGICGYETMYYRNVNECTGTSNTPCGISNRCQSPLICHDCLPPSSDTCAPSDYNPCVYGESPI